GIRTIAIANTDEATEAAIIAATTTVTEITADVDARAHANANWTLFGNNSKRIEPMATVTTVIEDVARLPLKPITGRPVVDAGMIMITIIVNADAATGITEQSISPNVFGMNNQKKKAISFSRI